MRNAPGLLPVLAAIVAIGAAGCAASTSPGATASVVPNVTAATPTAPLTPSPGPTATPQATGGALPASGQWTMLSIEGPAPAPREAHTWTVDPSNGAAYLFGGRDGATVFDDLWRFEPSSEGWEQLRPSGPAPAARFGHNAVWLPDGGLVVFAGQSAAGFFNDLWRYDPATGSWSELPAGGAPPIPRYGSCAALGTDGRLWMSHGFTEDRVRFADTRAYDFDAGAWLEATPTAGELPVARCLHACFFSQDGRRFVLYGGQTTGVAALGDLWALELTARTAGPVWSKLDEPAAPARNLSALAVGAGAVIAFGGGSLERGYLDDTWAFSLADLASAPVATSGGPPPARSGAALVADDGGSRLFLFGGRDGDEAFGDTWTLELR